MAGKVYLIPTVLHPDEQALQTLPAYLLDAVKDCQAFFVEDEKTARRFLKKMWREMVIDDYEWYTIHKAEKEVRSAFTHALKQNKNVGIISDAGCPGIADPGQILIEAAQQIQATVKPLVGPSSILLALMASGMNGQCFTFVGYLPIDSIERKKKILEIEESSAGQNCTQIFIETPYRNNQMMASILQICKPETMLCVAADITGSEEKIKTKSVEQWKKQPAPELHKKPVIFLIYAGK